uniref:hypothetical protein n=1 Tax=Ningiella ruwaisensis TaxID=2364274 RepID=UPI0019D518B5|nr:hypothetical protein [Ningiella ruwaisensis]
MTFKEFLEKSQYSEVYASHCLLYKPKSRVAKIAEALGYKPTEADKKMMIQIRASKKAA